MRPWRESGHQGMGRIAARLAVILASTALVALGILRLDLDTRPASFLPDDAPMQRWSDLQRAFGGDPLVVLVDAEGEDLLRPPAIASLVDLEGRIAALPDVAVVYGPGSVLNQVVGRVQDLVLELVGHRDALRYRAESEAIAAGASAEETRAAGDRAVEPFDLRYGPLLVEALPAGLPTMHNAAFLRSVVLDGTGEVRAGLRWVIPDPGHAAVFVRPREGLRQEELRRLAEAVMREGDHSDFAAESRVTVTGAPALAAALGDQVRREAPLLAVAALLTVAAAFLALGTGARLRRLVPLGCGVAGAATVLAVLGWLDLPLSIGALAFLPVVLGVGTDFPLHATGTTRRTVIASAAATASGFASMALSPLPFVRQLGILLAAGVLAATGFGIRAAAQHAPAAPPSPTPSLHGGRRPPSRRLVAALVATGGVAGWVLLPSLPIEARPDRLAAGLPAINELHAAEDVLGASGEIAVRLTGVEELGPEALRWFARSEEELVTRFGDRLRPILTPHRLLGFLGPDATDEQVRAAARLLPGYLLRAVANPVHGEVIATYGLRLGDLASQRDLLAAVAAALPDTPHGTSVSIDGLPVVASHALDLLDSSRHWPNVVGILTFATIVLLVMRELRVTLVATAVAVSATGWATLLLWSSGRSLSPLALSIGSLSVAVGGEFTLVLHDRLRRGVPSPWRPVLVAAATSIAGFAVLGMSSLAILRELAVVLTGAVVVGGVVGGALVWATTAPCPACPTTRIRELDWIPAT